MRRSSRRTRRSTTPLVVLGALVALVLCASSARAAPAPPPPPPGSTMRSAPVDPQAGQAAKSRLDARGTLAPSTVSAWWVDPDTHQTVVAVVGPPSDAASRFAADDDAAAVRIVPMSAPVRLLDAGPLVGGMAVTTPGIRCSDGFSARRGATTYLLTAGHCTAQGRTWSGPGRRPIGTVVTTRYPGSDYGVVQVTDPAAWRGSGRVQGGPTVTGVGQAPRGARICRSGSTSGYHCGVVSATDVTVNYGHGTVVSGLTQTTVCADPGDSGGPYVTPDALAQGTLSGGTGDCVAGGTTYVQPLAPVLRATGLTLVTGG